MAAVHIRDIWEGRPADRSWLVGQRRAPPRVLPGRWGGGTSSPSEAAWHFFLDSSKFPCSRCDSPNVTRSESCPSEQMCDLIHPIYPQSLSVRDEPCASLSCQTEPRAFDPVVCLVGTGPRPAHSVFIGRN